MLGESQCHRWRAWLIALRFCRHREAQGVMRTYPIVLKQLHEDQGIPGGVPFGKRMSFASQGIESITQGTIDALNMDGTRFGDHLAQGSADRDGEEFAMLIAMFDGLRQAHVCWHHQRRASTATGTDGLTIGSSQARCIATPAIATPRQGTTLRASNREGHCSLDEIVADASGGAGGDKATGAILHEASPAFTGISFVGLPVFFRTNDQNSSISTVERCRSCVRTAVKASACSLARRNHSPIVSYVWPVISSAARKLPRRITINSAWAPSAAEVCKRYIGVPAVSPKKRPHLRQ